MRMKETWKGLSVLVPYSICCTSLQPMWGATEWECGSPNRMFSLGKPGWLELVSLCSDHSHNRDVLHNFLKKPDSVRPCQGNQVVGVNKRLSNTSGWLPESPNSGVHQKVPD